MTVGWHIFTAVYLGCTHIGMMESWMAHINSSVMTAQPMWDLNIVSRTVEN